MEGLAQQVLARMPLAEAVLYVWRWAASEAFLERVYEQNRGRGFTRILSFPLLVYLLADALLVRDGSGREAFEAARDEDELPTSIAAAYGKLRRLPPSLSEAFLAETAGRLRSLWPAGADRDLPDSLANFDVFVLDGKTVKGLHKRLKPLRNVAGGMVGGKALVALELRTGLVLRIRTHLDGDASEMQFIPDLVEQLPRDRRRQRLWLGDRAFSYLEHVLHLGHAPDEFLVRRRANVTFETDRKRRARTGVDAEGRRWREAWGWLSRHRQPRALYVRQITLHLHGGKTVVLLTSLLAPRKHPAAALLTLYRQRWRIERVFQEITEVFGLEHLIGSSPQASIFQFAFCLLLYNTLQVVRAGLAEMRELSPERLSNEKLFRDLHRQLSAWTLLVGPALALTPAESDSAPQTPSTEPVPTPAQAQQSLRRILQQAWSRYWLKSPPQRRSQKSKPKGPGKHVSAYRVIQQSQSMARSKQ
jgi:hypothetical protein